MTCRVILSSCLFFALEFCSDRYSLFADFISDVRPILSFERFTVPLPVCVIANSSRVTDEMFQAVSQRLSIRFHGPCKKISFPMEAPFLDTSKALWRGQAPNALFAFWLDVQTQDLIIRGFDLSVQDEKSSDPILEWAYQRLPTSGITYEALRSVVASRIDQMIDQYPFVGIIEMSGFFSWVNRPLTRVVAGKRTKIERHPFLPLLIGYNFLTEKNTEAELKLESEGLMQIRFLKDLNFDPVKRMWLKGASSSKQQK